MKKIITLITVALLGSFGVRAAGNTEVNNVTYNGYGDSFVFDESGVTFSVYPNGEFDFYIDQYVGVGANVQVGNVNITFNSGYNYNPYVQYDDYGAVIQVEDIPIYYDYYGRVSAIGSVNIIYNSGRLIRIGGLQVFYNGARYSHCSGYINVYNRTYVYRPFYTCFVIPTYHVVYTIPYRRYYKPTRYTYYGPYYKNSRQPIVSVGHTHRSSVNGRGQGLYDNKQNRRETNPVANNNNGGRRSTVNNGNQGSENHANHNTRNEQEVRANTRNNTATPENNGGRVRQTNTVQPQQNTVRTQQGNGNHVRATEPSVNQNSQVRQNTRVQPNVKTQKADNQQTRANTNRGNNNNTRSGRRGN